MDGTSRKSTAAETTVMTAAIKETITVPEAKADQNQTRG
jgi:hypothetical protein